MHGETKLVASEHNIIKNQLTSELMCSMSVGVRCFRDYRFDFITCIVLIIIK